MLKFWRKSALSGNVYARIWKNYCRLWNQYRQICQSVKFWKKIKIAKFCKKTFLYGYFWLKLQKYILIFENSTLKFWYFQNFWRKLKSLNFESKVPYLGMFVLEFYKTFAVFEISTLELVNYQIFADKRNCLYFRLKGPSFGIIRLEFLKKVLSYLKLAPSNLSIWKISLNFGTKVAYMDAFVSEFYKTIFIFEFTTLKFAYFQNFAKKIKILKFWTKSWLFDFFGIEFQKN